MLQKRTSLLWPPFVVLAVFSATSAADEIDFSHQVAPILKRHCAECHASAEPQGDFSLRSRESLIRSGHVKPGQPRKSRLLQLIRSQDSDERMPPDDRAPLSPDEIDVLSRWIAAGLPWEDGFHFSPSDYEPPLLPVTVKLPPAEFPGQNPIDRLLSRYRGEHQLPPYAAAADWTFLRRAYMDLIGLPPTLEEQQAFFDSPDSQRRTRLIDQLLQRDRDYAEHWLSFWNDLLRNDYAGTGYIDGGRKQITAWLYSSLLNNKPYDQFVRELIAPTPESEGFIRGIKWRGNVNASQVREIQFSQNVSQVFLGINMKCASCHDSFIDRWTLDQAYSLAAVYSTRELEIFRCDKPTGRKARPGWIFPELGNIDPNADQPLRLQQLAELMTDRRNGRFSRTIVNRLWHRLMGRGIVHPVDAMSTRPWNADLLDWLAEYLVQEKYDLKKVLRIIATSDAYQTASVPATELSQTDEYVFRGPLPKHVTAEQFLDSVWQLTGTWPARIDAPIPADLYEPQVPSEQPGGEWIWDRADVSNVAAGATVKFLKEFEIAEVPSRASIVITCDNEYILFVNGQRVGRDTQWETVESFDIRHLLKSGRNTVRVVGRNAGDNPNPAALYAELILTHSDGTVGRIATDATWKIDGPVKEATQQSQPRHAAAISAQGFLGAELTARIARALGIAMHGSQRHPRASLMRSNLLMRSLGRPNREQVVSTRPPSLSTLQAIDLANGEILTEILAEGAGRLMYEAAPPAQFVQRQFRRAVCRPPTDKERDMALSLLTDAPTRESIQDFLWLLIMLPEFQFVY